MVNQPPQSGGQRRATRDAASMAAALSQGAAIEEDDVYNGLMLAVIGRRRLMVLLSEDDARRGALVRRLARNVDSDGSLAMLVQAGREAEVEHLVAAGARGLLPAGQPDPGFEALVDLAADRLEQAGAGVLVVERADLLPAKTLRDLRELSDTPSASGRFLQILLAGTPALEQKLAGAGLGPALQETGTLYRLAAPAPERRAAAPARPAAATPAAPAAPQPASQPAAQAAPRQAAPAAPAARPNPAPRPSPAPGPVAGVSAAPARGVVKAPVRTPPAALAADARRTEGSGRRSGALWLAAILLAAGAGGAYLYGRYGGELPDMTGERTAAIDASAADPRPQADPGITAAPLPVPAAPTASRPDTVEPAPTRPTDLASAAPAPVTSAPTETAPLPVPQSPAAQPPVPQSPVPQSQAQLAAPTQLQPPSRPAERPVAQAPAPADEPVSDREVAGPRPPALPPAEAVQPVSPSADLAALLSRGRRQIEARQITTPGPDNALGTLRELEALAPGSREAAILRAEIVGTYRRWASLAVQRGEIANARVYYQRALRVEPQNREITDALDRLDERPPARRRPAPRPAATDPEPERPVDPYAPAPPRLRP
ncbi:MAG TPA: AAA family ATPase [Azospirillaceae bacterium]|nr:AAA family ATPase [Azospirillaceae bacterium]